MRLRWTLVGAPTDDGSRRRGAPVADATADGATDVMVDCARGTTLGQLGSGEGGHLLGSGSVVVDGATLPPSAVVGLPPLLDGAVLRMVPGPTGCAGNAGAPPAGDRGGDRRHPALPTRGRPGPLLELAVLAGPDAGRTFPLTGTRVTCGRASSRDIVIADPRLSRAHCDIVVGTEGVSLVDLGSTNGSVVGSSGARPDTHTGLRLGGSSRLGASLVTVRSPATLDPRAIGRPTTSNDDGTVRLLRSPRTRPLEHAPELRLPPPARRARSNTFPVLSVVLPALAGGALALWTGSAVYLLLALLGPVLVAGGWVSTRRDNRREGALTAREREAECARVHVEARTAADRLARARARALPDADALLLAARGPSRRLWERGIADDDALRVRLGTAATDPPDLTGPDGSAGPVGPVGPVAAPAPTGMARSSRAGTARPGAATVLRPVVQVVDHDGRATAVTTAQDLVDVDLRDGALGIVERPLGTSAARFVVGQLVALLPPDDLLVVPVVGPAADERWRWLWLLPHCAAPDGQGGRTDAPAQDRGPGADGDVPAEVVVWPAPAARAARTVADLVAARQAVGTTAPAVLAVVDDPDALLGEGDLAWVPEAHTVGVHVVVVAADHSRLPRGLRHVVVPVSDDGVEAAVLRPDETGERFVPDRVGAPWAERLARFLAPLRLAPDHARAALPDQVGLQDLVDLRADAVAERWARAPDRSLAVPLGADENGPYHLDLAEVGPHALVAGTTGSGKSELLRAWLLGMSATYPPEHLALLLVDYKGGATFDDLAGLPHVVGLLTDLDGAATSRVLQSMKAEVRRREHVLAEAGARDLASYRALPAGSGPTLGRLLVVVDEFRVLAEEAPDVLGEFVRLAATGRSLGIHLVLATQRPGGVVSADIRANTGLRIALRVQDAGESRDVVDGPEAAALPVGRPGRAVVLAGGARTIVQGAWVRPDGTDGGRRTCVRPVVRSASDGGRAGPGTAIPRRLHRAAADPARTDPASAAVAEIDRAARSTGRSRATSPWLPALPQRLVVAPQRAWPGAAAGNDNRAQATSPVHDGLVLATADLPWAQARATLAWRPVQDGAALVLGGPRSGRSTTLATAAAAAAALGVPVVSLSGEFEDADHTVDVLAAMASPAAGPDDAGPPVPGRGPDRLRRLLLVDDTDSLLDPAADPAAVDLLLRLVRSGHRDGTGVMLAGGRSLAAARLAGGAGPRFVHRTADRADALLAGVPSDVRATSSAPGRCLVVGLPSHGQGAASWGRDVVVEAQVHLPPGDLADATRTPMPPGVPAPLPFRARLPAATTAPSRTGIDGDTPDDRPDGRWLAVGLVGPDRRSWGPDLGPGALWVVAGPSGSGRSNALDTIARQATAAGVELLRLDDGAVRGDSGIPPADPPLGSARPAASPDAAGPSSCHARTVARLLLVDDVDLLPTTALEALETWLVRRAGPLSDVLDPEVATVIAGSTEWFAGEFRGVPALVRRHGQGVVLHAGRTDTRDVLGVRSPLTQLTRVPGRGLLVDRGRVGRIQLLLPGSTPRPAADLAVRDADTAAGH